MESVGRAIGATQIAAAKLREEVEEGKIRAIIEQDAKAESERLERERRLPREEIDAWDGGSNSDDDAGRPFSIPRANGACGGYSNLRRGELLRLWSARFTETRTPRRMRRSDERRRLAGRGWCHHFTRVASRVASRHHSSRAHPSHVPTSHLTNPASNAFGDEFGVARSDRGHVDDAVRPLDATGEHSLVHLLEHAKARHGREVEVQEEDVD